MNKKKVFIGMSGGVDSSVAALLLKQRGYDVTGVYMKNWAKDIPGFLCPWEEDLRDADAVAAQIGIDLKVFDFEKQYHDKVVEYMLEGYQAGLTPNPDIMCNQEIKFKLFLDTSKEEGAELIATGHYSRIRDGRLLKAIDDSKDQSYFLYRVTSQALKQSLFPLGELKKTEVRAIAEKTGLITARKKDSVGICFVGQVGIKEFLSQFVQTKSGPIVNQHGQTIGEHDGAIFYTIGQRHGLGVGGGLPYYVVDKDILKNIVYVTTDLDDERLWSDRLKLINLHWIKDQPKVAKIYQIRARYQSPLIKAKLLSLEEKNTTLELKKPLKAAAPGQSAVIYDGDVVLGGGIITI